MEENKKQEVIKKDSMVTIEFMINDKRIVGRDSNALFLKYRGVEKKESDWIKILKEKGYIR